MSATHRHSGSDSPAFEYLCQAIEEDRALVSFGRGGSPESRRLAVRGTVRLALRKAGLSTRTVTRKQMIVVLTRLMPTELSSRGVDNAEAVCRRLIEVLKEAALAEPVAEEAPVAVFRLLGGDEV